MSTNPLLNSALWLTDQVFALIPRRTPTHEAFVKCKIISHRGEHDNHTVFENTMEAFRLASDAGAWGLEMDVRWTRDLVPMVAHDRDTKRVFGVDITIADITFAELRDAVPAVPTLEEFVAEFGGKIHLMIELKEEEFPELEQQKTILKEMLQALKPGEDFHLLALDPELFNAFDIVPSVACLPVATFNFKQLSEAALENKYAGISGHFLVLGNAMKQRHEAAGQLFGTGFPSSKNALYRELNRGVEYVFTNDAVKLLALVDAATRQ